MNSQKGIIHLLPLLLIVLVVVVVLGFLFIKGGVKTPFTSKEPKIQLKSQYSNPFDKKSQYVNPFDSFKNPLVTAK